MSCSPAILAKEIGLQPGTYGGLGHAFDRFIDGISSRFRYILLFYLVHQPICEHWVYGTKVP